MIIFGIRTKLLTNVPPNFVGDCHYCKTAGSLHAQKEVRYFHIFWIPILPFKSQIVTICGHCKKVNYQYQIDRQTRKKIRAVGMPKTPKRYFAGVIIIALFFIAIIIIAIYSTLKTNEYLENPKIGDVYKIELEEDGKPVYTLYRIARLTTDSITFEVNDYEARDRKGFRKLQEQQNDSYGKKIVLSWSQLLEMNDEDQISSINRN